MTPHPRVGADPTVASAAADHHRRDTLEHSSPGGPSDRGWTVWVIWIPGLLVAVGAAVATAHGLFEVALAAGAPTPIAWLYPLITDGLALVAYAATARLAGPGRRYAWTVVVLAAGLSGLAQANYLADGVDGTAPAVLRFGVGAWPAIAAAIVAHLLFLLATDHGRGVQRSTPDQDTAVHPGAVQPTAGPAVQAPAPPAPPAAEHPPTASNQPPATARRCAPTRAATQPPAPRPADSPARDRARATAGEHQTRHGALPTVSQLMGLAAVSRGTAATALRDLRDPPAPLHIVASPADERTPQ